MTACGAATDRCLLEMLPSCAESFPVPGEPVTGVMQSAEGCSSGGGGPAGFRSSGPCSALSGGTLPEGGSERGRPIPRNQRCAAGRSGLGALTGSCGRVCPRRGGSRRRGGRPGASAAPTATACGERGPHGDAGIPAGWGGGGWDAETRPRCEDADPGTVRGTERKLAWKRRLPALPGSTDHSPLLTKWKKKHTNDNLSLQR